MKKTTTKFAAAAVLLALMIVLSSCGLNDPYYKMERESDGTYNVMMQKGEVRYYDDDDAKIAVKDIYEKLISDTERNIGFTITVTPKDGNLISVKDFSYELQMADDYAKEQDCLRYTQDVLMEPSAEEQSYSFEINGIELAKGTEDMAWLERLNVGLSLSKRVMGALKEKDGMMIADYEDVELAELEASTGFTAEGSLKGASGYMIAEEYRRTETLEESMGFTHTGITGFFTDLFSMLRRRNPGSD
ncbi:MAG: hypothetical protein II971_01350 [Firmicutes bacterium]|nr:hypothetical protein [Bacillota bacterium]